VLQVGIHEDGGLAPRLLQPRVQRRLLAEVAGEVDHHQLRTGAGQLVEDAIRAVAGAVVDAEDLVAMPEAIEGR